MATLEGGTLCHQEIGRQAALRGIGRPAIVACSPASDQVEDLPETLASGDFSCVGPLFGELIGQLKAAGATFAIIPANTVHFAFDQIASRSPLPLLSILDVVARNCVAQGYRRVGILGTAATMQGRLYDTPLDVMNIATVYPDEADMQMVNRIILDELINGIFLPSSRDYLQALAHKLHTRGADAIILGCTELPLIMLAEKAAMPMIDSTRLLAADALDFAVRNT